MAAFMNEDQYAMGSNSVSQAVVIIYVSLKEGRVLLVSAKLKVLFQY
jgi:hypothetical protein